MIYDNVDKISNTICRPLPDLVLKHIVKVAYKDVKSGRREYFHKEVSYNSSTYNNLSRLTNVNLNFKSYLLLEESDKDFNERDNVAITYNNIYTFKRACKTVLDWFYNISDLTALYNGDLRIKDRYKNLVQEIYLNDGKVIRLYPTILLKDNIQYEGVRMLLNSEKNEYLFVLDNFAMLADIIIGADLYGYGLSVISYLGRPDEGMFSITMDNFAPNTVKQNGTVSKGMKEYMERRNNSLNNL